MISFLISYFLKIFNTVILSIHNLSDNHPFHSNHLFRDIFSQTNLQPFYFLYVYLQYLNHEY